MNISLREVTPQIFKECIKLKVAEAQSKFVAPNVVSIAQSKFYPTINTSAVYDGEEMVGFVMFGLDTDDGKYYLVRLMIDERHQGKGYGRAATRAVIEKMRANKDCRELYLSFVPENTAAHALYKSIGFEPTGDINEGEIVMRFDLTNNANPQSAIQNPKSS